MNDIVDEIARFGKIFLVSSMITATATGIIGIAVFPWTFVILGPVVNKPYNVLAIVTSVSVLLYLGTFM